MRECVYFYLHIYVGHICTHNRVVYFVITSMWIAKPVGAVYLENKLGFNFQLVT